jgi:hypothetical protein
MATNIRKVFGELAQRGEVELVEVNDIDDGTSEFVYEACDDAGRISVIRIYQLPES